MAASTSRGKGLESRLNSQLRRCKNCEAFTLEAKCPTCGHEPTLSPHPPRFSPDDKYLRLRLAERYAVRGERNEETAPSVDGKREKAE